MSGTYANMPEVVMMSYRNVRADIRDVALRTAFFTIAFVPLWLILSINCGIVGMCHWGIAIGLIVGIAVLVFCADRRMKNMYSAKELRYFKVVKKEDITHSTVFYIMAYIPALFVEKFTLTELSAFVILLVTVYLLYVKTNMLHINPVLTLIGYNTYRVTDDHSNTVVLLSRLSVRTGTEVPYAAIVHNVNLVLDRDQ